MPFSSYSSVPFVLGLLLLGVWLRRLSSFICLHLIHRSTLPRYLQTDFASKTKSPAQKPYALITGASDGIGLGFAQELLSSGFNVIIHGRNPTKLAKVQGDLQQQHPSRDIQTFIADASDSISSAEAFETLLVILDDPEITLKVLVNNVGGPGAAPHAAYSKALERLPDAPMVINNINTTFPAAITHALLPVLGKTQPSLILNMGSGAALFPPPYLCLYAASKAYNSVFSRSLSVEMETEGLDVEVLHVMVGRVLNQSSGDTKAGLFVPTSREFAKAALAKVGCGRRDVTAWWPHELQIAVTGMLPEWMVEKLILRVTRAEMALEGKGR